MKKFKMLIFSLIIFTLTIGVYFYDNNVKTPVNYKLPSLTYTCSKFGKITNISKPPNTNTPVFLILTNDANNISTLHGLNLKTNKSAEYISFPTHKHLKDKILFSSTYDKFILVNEDGLSVCNCNIANEINDSSHDIQNIGFPIKDFENVTSIAYDYDLFFKKDNTNLIYKKDINQGSFDFNLMLNKQKPTDESAFYKKSLSVVSVNMLDKLVYYTKQDKNGTNLYSLKISNNKSLTFNKPIVENFIHGKSLNYSYGICGMYEKNNKFNVFINNDNKNNTEIAQLPKNTDLLGQLPDFDTTNLQEGYVIVYSSFDENHNGNIYLKNITDNSIKLLVKNQPIVGTIKTFEYSINENEQCLTKVLFTTLENNKMKIKACDLNTLEIEDLTHYFNNSSKS